MGTEAQSAAPLTEELGAQLEQQLNAVARHASVPATKPRLTQLPEQQLNAFLRFQGARHLPSGITDAAVRIGSDDSLTVEAVLDLDAIRNSRPREWSDPFRYLGGQLTVRATGRAHSGNGVATVEVESVVVAGIPMPVQVLQEVVRHYTGTPERPDGTGLHDPIPLPYRIVEVRLSPGLAVIVQ